MKQIKLIFLLVFIFMICTMTSCSKEILDFKSAIYYGNKAVLKSENCDAKCGETADCEGEMIKVRGKLDESNINNSDHQFYIIDEKDSDFRLNIRVDESVSAEIFQKLDGMGGKVFLVEGEMEGYDAPTNATCKRQFFVRLNSVLNVVMQ